jgi:hypothetical protein
MFEMINTIALRVENADMSKLDPILKAKLQSIEHKIDGDNGLSSQIKNNQLKIKENKSEVERVEI